MLDETFQNTVRQRIYKDEIKEGEEDDMVFETAKDHIPSGEEDSFSEMEDSDSKADEVFN